MGIENVIKKIHVEPINRKAEYEAAGFLTREEVTAAMDRVADQVRCNMEYFGTRFPSSATRNQTYGVIDNIEWTDGFWTGLLWLCYEYTGDDAFKNLALKNVDSFLNRVEKRIELDHHDLGFLYSLSCVAGYKLTGSAEGRKAGLLAADKLMERFQEKGGFIQAWGELGARDNYRLIIDCLLNIPLLHWAFLETGKPVYRNAAMRHYEAACNNVIRDDASAYHTFYFLNRLPEDEVCYWDLIFTDGSNQSRDSSAAAIGVCGIHEMLKYLPEVESDKNTYRHAMHCILRSLMERYTAPEIKPGNPVLLHGVYSWHSGKGVDEGNIWGDYYYMEALMRFYKDWNLYW